MLTRPLGLIANDSKSAARDLTRELCRELEKHGRAVLMDARTAALAGAPESGATLGDLAEQCEIIVVLGGDGTILQVLHELGPRTCPVFGINLGSLGFLTSASAAGWREAVECIVGGGYKLSDRTLLHVEVLRGDEILSKNTALNDAVISRGELSRLIKIDVHIDGALLSEYNADGLIVSTSTGSTAYSLSAGGPVLTPNSGVFVITPICPHVLTMRSVIVSNESVIEIAPSRRQSDVFLTLDGQNAIHIAADERIRVVKAAHRLPLAMLPGTTFFGVLREKLKWSGSAI